METCFCENIKGLYETMDTEKRFDSSDHAFMTSVLKNLAFEHAFMTKEFDFRKILLSGLNFY